MASVHLGRLRGEAGFRRLVAVKILHAQLARDPEVRAMFLQEARIVSGIRHRHVVQTLDVLEDQGDLFLVMDYVDGVPVSRVMKDVFGSGDSVPVPVVIALVCDMLEGLHAAHEARSDDGRPLDIVHRDVSPQNVMVARDGSALVVDFGIARAADRGHLTTPGQIKGKAAYMAPEQAKGEAIDRRVDVYAASVIGWELLTGQRLFAAETFTQTVLQQLEKVPAAPSSLRAAVSEELDATILRGLAKSRGERFATARDMVAALEAASRRASRAEVSEYVVSVEAAFFREREEMLARVASDGDEGAAVVGGTVVGRAEAGSPSDTGAATMLEGGAPGPVRRRSPAALVGVLLLALVTIAGVGLGAVTLGGDAIPPPLAADAGAALPPPLPARAPEAPAVDAATATEAPVLDASLAVPVGAPAPERHAGNSRGHLRPPASDLAPPAPPPELPACCAGAIRLHFRDCRDNCPSEAPR